VIISDTVGRTPQTDAPMIVLKDVQNAYIHGCVAPRESSVFLGVSGAATRDVVIGDNQTRGAGQAVGISDDVPDGQVEGASTVPAI
jgi:hypothetical protein